MVDRVRRYVPRQPVWDDRFRNWAAKYITRNKWRCDPIDDFDDLLQDAYLVFRRVKASYPLVHEPKHLMALFKVAIVNEFNDKAKAKSKKESAEISLETLIGEDLKLIDSIGEDNNEGYLRVLLHELPKEVKLALEAFHDDEKFAELNKSNVQSRLARLAGLPARSESLNEMLCRIIHLPKTIDLIGMIRSALTNS
jgi:hypothetical protein